MGCSRPMLGILMYVRVHSGACASGGCNPPSLATLLNSKANTDPLKNSR
jgi:hypothetical protein